MSGQDLAILVPVWRRTTHLARVHESVRSVTPDARLVYVISVEDDPVLGWFSTHRDLLDQGDDVVMTDGGGGGPGDYAHKINAGYRATEEPNLFTGADDLAFHSGWYDHARPLLYDGIGVVGTVDLCNDRTMRGEHSTHSLVARWYADCCAVIDQPEAIYHEGYQHEYCDDELVRTAMSQGAYAHAFDAVVEHLHPLVGKSPDDETYQRGRSRSRFSRRTFLYRRHLWGDDGRVQ